MPDRRRCSLLCNCDWFCVYTNKNGDDTVDSSTNIILQATDLATPWNTISKAKFPDWFSSVLNHYIQKSNYFHRHCRKHNLEQYYIKLSYYQKLVKITNLTGLIGTKLLMMIRKLNLLNFGNIYYSA